MDNSEKDGDRHKHDVREEFYSDNRLQMFGVVNDLDDGFHFVSFCLYYRAIPMPAGKDCVKYLVISRCCVEFNSLIAGKSKERAFPISSNSWGKSGITFPSLHKDTDLPETNSCCPLPTPQ
jgi:hypothetical protein